eukprot:4799176-Pyramimonas_sp.AAC.1
MLRRWPRRTSHSSLCGTRRSRAGQPAPASVAARPRAALSPSSAEQPAPRHRAACPHVAAALEELSGEVLEWVTRNFLWGN